MTVTSIKIMVMPTRTVLMPVTCTTWVNAHNSRCRVVRVVVVPMYVVPTVMVVVSFVPMRTARMVNVRANVPVVTPHQG